MDAEKKTKAAQDIREIYDRLLAENDIRAAWQKGPMPPQKHPDYDRVVDYELEGTKQLFLLIPRICFADNACIFDEYSNSNRFNCTFVALLQYVLYVLQICAVRFDNKCTPPESYPLRVYLVPLPGVDGRTVDYMLIVDILEMDADPFDISTIFLELAKSQLKVINRLGQLVDGDGVKLKKPMVVPDEDMKDPHNLKYSIFREVVQTVRQYDKLLGIIAQHKHSASTEQLDVVNNLTLESVMRWTVDERIHPVNKLNPRYCSLNTYRKRRADDSIATVIPKELLRFIVPPDYWSPMLFSKQFMPHSIPDDYSTIFKNGLQKLFTESVEALKMSAQPDRRIQLYVRPQKNGDEDDDEDDLPGHNMFDTRDGMHERHVPTYADCMQASKNFGENHNSAATFEPANPVLVKIKVNLSRTLQLIRELNRSGQLNDDDTLAWQTDARRCAIAEYEKVKRDSSETSQKLYEYLEKNKLMDVTPELLIFDKDKSIFDNFLGWFIDILSVFCGVAVHQLTIVHLYILFGSAFDPPGSQIHALITGDGGSGKSFGMNALFSLFNRIGVINSETFSRGSEYIDRRVYGVIFSQDELSLNGLTDTDSNQLAERKAIMSQGHIMREALRIDENGDRKLEKLFCVKSGCWAGLMNKEQTSIVNSNPDDKTSMLALLSRYTMFDMSSISHYQRSVQFAKAAMNNPRIDKEFKGVVDKFVIFQRWRMEVMDLIFIGALPQVGMSAISTCMPKFEHVLSKVKIKSTSNRQGENVSRFCRQVVILRTLIERFCVRGVSPYFGQKYSTDKLLGLPTVAGLDDVAYACTALYHTYVPRHLTTVITLIREQMKEELDPDRKMNAVVFCEPTTSPLRPSRGNQNSANNNNNNVDMGELRSTQYIGFRDISLAAFGNKLWARAQSLPEWPSELAITTCLSILQNMMLDTYMHTWESGLELPERSMTNTRMTPRQGIVRCGHHIFINLMLLIDEERQDAGFDNLWKRAVYAMCDKNTRKRTILAGIPHAYHVWLPSEITLDRQANAVSIAMNPRYLSMGTRAILTGFKHGIIGGEAPKQIEDTPERVAEREARKEARRQERERRREAENIFREDVGGGVNVDDDSDSDDDDDSVEDIDETSRAFIDYDIDIGFAAHFNWIMDNSENRLNPDVATAFAMENQATVKIATMRSIIDRQLQTGEIPRKRSFINYPGYIVRNLDRLKKLHEKSLNGTLDTNELGSNRNKKIVIGVTSIMKSRVSEDKREAIDDNLAKIDIINNALDVNPEITPERFADMYDMMLIENEGLPSMVARRFEESNRAMYPKTATLHIDQQHTEPGQEYHVRMPSSPPPSPQTRRNQQNHPFNRRPAEEAEEADGEDDDEEGEEDDDDEEGGGRRKRKKSKKKNDGQSHGKRRRRGPKIVEVD